MQIVAGTTDISIAIYARATSGTALTGKTSGDFVLTYRRAGANVPISLSDLAELTTPHADGGIKEVGNGEYRLDLPDAACAAGASQVTVGGTVDGGVVIGYPVSLIGVLPADVQKYLGETAPSLKNDAYPAILVEGGPPTSGSWTITYNGTETTSGLNWNATAAEVQTALRALASLTPDKVAVTGDTWPVNGGVFTLTYTDLGSDPPEVTINSYLTGGDPTITPDTTQEWVAAIVGQKEIVVVSSGGATEGAFCLNGYGAYPIGWNASASEVAQVITNVCWPSNTGEGGPLDEGAVTVTASYDGAQDDTYVVTNNTTGVNPTVTVQQQGITAAAFTPEVQTITLGYYTLNTAILILQTVEALSQILTSARGGYIDNLAAGPVALASVWTPTIGAYLDAAVSSRAAKTDWSTTRGGYIDNLNVGGTVPTLAQFNARSLPTADYATAGTQSQILGAISANAANNAGIAQALEDIETLAGDVAVIPTQPALASNTPTMGALVAQFGSPMQSTYNVATGTQGASILTAIGTPAQASVLANANTHIGQVKTVVDSIGTVANKQDTTLEADGEDWKFTAAALIESPVGTGGFTSEDRTLLETAAEGGTGLTAQETRDAMKLAPSRGTPAAGSLDKQVDDIQTKTDSITAGKVTVYSVLTATGEIKTLVVGDAFDATNSRAILFVDEGDDWPTLSGTVHFSIAKVAPNVADSLELTIAGTITTSAGHVAVLVPLIGTDTSGLTSGQHVYDLRHKRADGEWETLVSRTHCGIVLPVTPT